jgi:glycosyltransferase involved in cell wall biosynthesis
MYFRNQFYHPADNLSGIIYVSNFSKQKHLQYEPRFKNVKSIVLYNSVEQNKRIKEKNSSPYFLFFGRLSREKGIISLINAFLDLPDQQLKIVGTGMLYDEILEMTKESKNIEVLGYRSGKQLQDIVEGAHFVIIPSEWYENNPMTIIEAYSLGVPVIGTNIGGIPEIIEDGKTGFIVEPYSKQSLKNAVHISSQLTDEQYSKMSNFAVDFAKRNFEETNYYHHLINFYKETLNLKL